MLIFLYIVRGNTYPISSKNSVISAYPQNAATAKGDMPSLRVFIDLSTLFNTLTNIL